MNYEYLGASDQLIDLAKHLILPVFVSAFGGLAGLFALYEGEYAGSDPAGLYYDRPRQGVKRKGCHLQARAAQCAFAGHYHTGAFHSRPYRRQRYLRNDFAIPGMGQLFYMSVMARDYPTIMGILLIGAILTLAGNLIADVSYALADPRIRIS